MDFKKLNFMQRIGFITGIEKEALILKKTYNYTESEIIWTNMDPDRAYTQAKKLAKDGYSTIISFGFSAALDPNLAAGDLVLPTTVVDAAGRIFPTDVILHKKMKNHFSQKFSTVNGTVFGSDKIIWEANEKKQIFDIYSATTVDMESLGIAKAAEESGCSFLIVRAISDTASQNLPMKSLKSITVTGRIKIINIIWNLLTNLNESSDMLKLALNSRKAQTRLHEVARFGFGI